MITFLKLFSVMLLVLVNGFFVAAEFAFVGVRRSRIEALAESGDRRAKRLIDLLANLNAYLSAAQLGITLASLGLGYLGEPAVASLLEGPLGRAGVSDNAVHIISFIVAFGIITSLHIVIGEQAPKLIGLERAEKVALASALPMRIFFMLGKPLVYALDWASARVVRLFGLHASSEHASIYTQEELRQVIEMSRKGGHINTNEQELINRVFDFADAEVREAMIPRTAVMALPATATLAEAEAAFCEHGYSRMPVFRERLDDIVGVLFMKDLMPCLRTVNPVEFELEKVLHPPLFIPATAKLGAVLAQMQSAKTHIA
ncbi:MAG: HlyC/CorC family transporter, partial [Acidobacteria bacterium]|nr:HlyC/CorC family transporter [Acidobacteriota bacterium]